MDPRRLGLSDDDLEALGYRVRRDFIAPPTGESSGQARAAGPDPSSRRPVSPTVRGARSWFWTTAVLLVAAWMSSTYRQRPAPLAANSPDTVFSSGRAMSQLVEVVAAPRPPGSPEHARVRAYLEERLRALGLEPEIQVVTAARTDSATAEAATVENVIARLPGTASTGAVLVTAHYDGFPASSGAGDNGIGIAAILETLRVVGSGEPLGNDLIVLFSDAEEMGGLGARAFAQEHPWMADVAFVLSMDMRGASGPAWMTSITEGKVADTDVVASAARHALAHSLAREIAVDPDTDPGIAGSGGRAVPSLRLMSTGSPEAYHQSWDVAERVSEPTLAHGGTQLLALVRHLGRVDFGAPETSPTDQRVYLPLAHVGVISYPATWSLLGTIGLWLGWFALALVYRLRGGSPRRALVGVGVAALAVGAAAVAGRGLVVFLQVMHSEYGRVEGAVFNDGVHVAALAALTLGIVTLLYGVARIRFRRDELFLGVLLIPLALLVWTTVRAPFASPALQLPLAFALVLGGLVVVAFPNRLGGSWAWRAFMAVGALMLLTAIPGLEWLAAALTPRESVLLGAAFSVCALLMLPIVDWLLAPRIWWTPSVALVASLTLVVVALPRVQGDERHPELTSLVLLVDDTMTATRSDRSFVGGEAVAVVVPGGATAPGAEVPPATGADADSLDSSSATAGARRVPGRWLVVRGPGEEWARSWAVPGSAGGREPSGVLLPDDVPWEVAGTGNAPELAPLVVEVASDTVMSGLRHLRVVVRPGLGGEMLGLRLADDVVGGVVSINGRDLSEAGAPLVRRVRHWGAVDARGILFDLEVDPASTEEVFDVIEHHLRPSEVLGTSFFVRNRTEIADASTGSDRVVRRTRVRVTVVGDEP